MPAPRRWDRHYSAPLFDREPRLATHRNILGPGAACDRCGETRLPALRRDGHEVVCYECQAEAEGRSPVEQDHVLGRSERFIHYTVPTPGNLHRLLSDPDFGPEARMRQALELDARLSQILRRHDS